MGPTIYKSALKLEKTQGSRGRVHVLEFAGLALGHENEFRSRGGRIVCLLLGHNAQQVHILLLRHDTLPLASLCDGSHRGKGREVRSPDGPPFPSTVLKAMLQQTNRILVPLL